MATGLICLMNNVKHLFSVVHLGSQTGSGRRAVVRGLKAVRGMDFLWTVSSSPIGYRSLRALCSPQPPPDSERGGQLLGSAKGGHFEHLYMSDFRICRLCL